MEFLDSVLESTRAKEAAIRKETKEQLDSFRKQQEDVEKAALVEDTNDASQVQEEQWIMRGRKRKKGQDRELVKGLKLRKSSSTDERKPSITSEDRENLVKSSADNPKTDFATKSPQSASPNPTSHIPKTASPPQTQGLGLGGYSSDEE